MNPTLRKAILLALGAVSLSKEKIENFVAELKKEGVLDEEEARELFEEALKRTEENARVFAERVREEVEKVLENLLEDEEDECHCGKNGECECHHHEEDKESDNK